MQKDMQANKHLSPPPLPHKKTYEDLSQDNPISVNTLCAR